jgi:hypothetical protein
MHACFKEMKQHSWKAAVALLGPHPRGLGTHLVKLRHPQVCEPALDCFFAHICTQHAGLVRRTAGA